MKKLNIAILTVLLVFQTLLSPVATYASTTDAIPLESTDGTLETDANEGDGVNSAIPTQQAVTTTPPTGGVEFDRIVDLAKVLDTKLSLNVTSLTAGSKNILDDATYRPTQNELVEILYNFKIEREAVNDGDYLADSYFEFQLPQSVLVFDTAKMSGSISDEEDGTEFAKYSTDTNGKVTVKLLVPLEPGNIREGTITFEANFGNVNSETGLEQKLDIPLLGTDKIERTYTFKPDNLTSQPMTKKGTPTKCDATSNDKCIEWEIWVNQNAEILKDPKITDTIQQYQQLQGDIEIVSYPVGFGGVDISKGTTTTATEFPIVLAVGETMNAFKISYKTKVTPATDSTEKQTYSNEADLTTSNGVTDKGKDDVEIQFGTALSKELLSGSNKYEANWAIKYNYLQATIKQSTAQITDKIPNLHEYQDIKVYQVAINADGTEGAKTLVPADGTVYTLSKGTEGKNNTFTIEFNKNISEAYYIEYGTKSKEQLITNKDIADAGITASTLTNTVTALNLANVTKQAHLTGMNSGLVNKIHGTPNYQTKEITWTITVKNDNPSLLLTGPIVVTDTLPAGLTYKSGSAGATGDPTIVGQILTWTLNDSLAAGQSKTISYTTAFDTSGNVEGGTYTAFTNSISVDFNDNTTAVAKETTSSTFTPSGNSKNNGYKSGSYNQNTREFTWTVGVNYNLRTLTNAKVEDKFGLGHFIDLAGTDDAALMADLKSKITMNELTLGAGDDFTIGNVVNASEWDIESLVKNAENKVIGFTIKFNTTISGAYQFVYNTKDLDDIVGYLDENKKPQGTYKNSATLKADSVSWLPINGEAKVPEPNNLLTKEASADRDSGVITWTLEVNKSKSVLKEVVLHDTPSDNQKILWETFKLKDEKGTETIPVVKPSADKKSFTIDLGDLPKNQNYSYTIHYQTYFDDESGKNYSNKAHLTYKGNVPVEQDTNQEKIASFTWNDSNASGSSARGTIKFKKIGLNEDTGSENPLANVQFELWNRTGTVKLQDAVTSDADGYFQFENVRYGMYRIKEVGTVSGYVNAEGTLGKSVVLKADTDYLIKSDDAVQKFTNKEIIHALRIVKEDTDDASKKLEGAQFEITDKATGKEISGSPFKTDVNGEISLSIAPGTYTVTEIKAPFMYVLNNTPFDMIVTETQTKTTEKTVTNKRIQPHVEGELELTKVDLDSKQQDDSYSKVLEGAEFELWYGIPDDTESLRIDKGTTDTNGRLNFKVEQGNNYYLKEVKAPQGYDLSKSVYKDGVKVTVSSTKNNLVVENEFNKGDLTLKKSDIDDTNKLLEGAEFTLYENAAATIEVTKGTTDNNGEIRFAQIPYGTYYLQETKAPEGYDLSKSEYNTPQEISISAQNATLSITNEVFKGNLEVSKVDKTNNSKKLAGAQFELWQDVEGKVVIDTKTTDSNGYLVFENLIYGDYYLIETKAPANYDLSKSVYKDPVKVTIGTEIKTLDVENEAIYTPPTDPGTPPTDPGTPPTDPGTPPTDPGTPPTDPGTPPTDPGTPPTDPGTPPTDPGTPPTDPGTPPTDPGTPPTDPGTPPTDPGTPPTDPGTPPTDPGTPPTDPGTPPTDPGTPPTDPGTNPGPSTNPETGVKPDPETQLPPRIINEIKDLKDLILRYPAELPTDKELDRLLGLYKDYLKMTPEQKRAFEKLLDINALKEILLGEGVKLPQTDGNVSTTTTLIGLALLAIAAFIVRRRQTAK